MMVLVTYDVETQTDAGKRRLRHVSKLCQNHGQRVQYSVFECWVELKAKLVAIIDADRDSLRFYFLGANWHNRIEHVGTKAGYDPEGPLIL